MINLQEYEYIYIYIYVYIHNMLKNESNYDYNDWNNLETEKCIKTGDYVEIKSDLMSN